MNNPIQISYESPTLELSLELEQRVTQIFTDWFSNFEELNGHLSLFFCGEKKIEELNFRYRKKKKPTDILSFVYETQSSDFPNVNDLEEQPWGELIVCTDIVKLQAKEAGMTFEIELIRLLAHGFTHLRGLDHQDERQEAAMLAAEIKLLEQVGLGSIYS